MKKYICFLLLITTNFVAIQLAAQTDTINKTTAVKTDVKKQNKLLIKSRPNPIDSEFVIDNKRLRYYNNWMTFGAGWQQNLTYKRKLGFIGGIDLNIHIKENYFQLGTTISGETYRSYNSYQLHVCYGKRYENTSFHYAAFMGVSFSSGYAKVGDTIYSRKFNQPGVYFEGEIVKKIAYDVGFGGSLFVDINAEQTIIGLRFMMFFSGAYGGKKHHYEDN